MGINDTGYFYGSFQRILCAAELMGLDEVFADPDVQKFIWDRLLYEVTPDGAVVPYGAHGGWNSSVGDRIFALELASAHTKDGKYRWAAHHLMDYLMKHGSDLRNQHHIHATNIEAIALASHVILNVTNYMGYEAEHEREVFFIKNRFAVVRDLTTFSDNFKCRIGPVWNTQHLDMHSNVSWLNTYFDRFYFQGATIYDNPRSDLLVYHLPKQDCRLEVEQRRELENAGLSTRYTWEGEVSPGFRIQFGHLLLPHPPELSPDSLAEGIKVKQDELNLVLLQLQIGEERVEWILLNPEGKEFASPEPGSENTKPFKFSTDARALYLDVQDGKVSRVLAIDAKFLSVSDEDLLRQHERSDFEH